MSGASVLVVDDEVGMRETLADIFAGAGYEVASAPDGDQAVNEVLTKAFDVLVMDMRMPGRDGLSVLADIDGPPPQVILMTAYALEEQIRRALERRAYAVVHKPVQVGRLLGLVAGAVREHAADHRPVES